MFGLRYHIATICGMLLMLGFGFWLGSTSGFGTAFVKGQTTTISGLNAKLDTVLQDSERDHRLLRTHEDALNALVPGLVSGKLSGKRVAIVRTGDYGASAQAAVAAVTAAGGTVLSTTTITSRLEALSTDDRSKIFGDLKVAIPEDPSSRLTVLLHPLVACLLAGTGSRPDLQTELSALSSDGIVDTSGDYTTPVSAVVVIGGWSDDPGQGDNSAEDSVTGSMIERALIAALQAGSITVVGCESSDAAFSSVPDYSAAGVPSIDCIDLPLGALDLPYTLRGSGDTASYGVKSTATRLIPAELDNSANAQAAPTH